MKKLICMLLAIGLMLGLTACGSSSKDYAVNEMAMEAPMAADSAAGFVEELTTGTETGSQALPDSRKWIITVDMDAETEDLEGMLRAMDEKIGELGGFVEDQRVNNGSTYSSRRYRSAWLTVRVPAERVDEFTTHMEGISNVTSSSKSLEDITLTYVSTESRMKALQTEEARLLELMEMAETMSDLLEIESRLTDVRWELESVTSQLRTFDNQVNYATIYLSISEVTEYTPVEEKTVWQRIGEGFVRSIKGVWNGAVELFVWVIVNIPYLLIFGALGYLAFRIIRKQRARRKARKNQPKAE